MNSIMSNEERFAATQAAGELGLVVIGLCAVIAGASGRWPSNEDEIRDIEASRIAVSVTKRAAHLGRVALGECQP